MKKCALTVLFAFAVSCCFAAATPQEAQQWREDIKFFHDRAPEVHKSLYHDMKPAEFDAAVADLSTKIPEMSRNQIIVGLMKIVAMIKDGHTYVAFDGPAVGFHQLPIRLWNFPEGLYVIAADQKYAPIVGGRIVKIGNASVDEVLNQAAAISPRDNQMTVISREQYHLKFPEILNGLGFIDDPSKVAITVEKDGKQVSAVVEPEPFDPDGRMKRHMSALPEGWITARSASSPVPLWQKHPDDPYWFEYLANDRVLYVQYNEVRQKSDESITDFIQKVMKFADEHPVDKFVFDLRQNGGGNNFLNMPFIHAFIRSDKVNQPGKLYTVIGRQTFSAAGNCVNEMRKHTSTLFIGEPSGFRPNMYGDPTPLALPNSKIPVYLSTLWWQDNDPRDARPWQAPDLFVPLTFADYREGRDPIIETVLHHSAELPVAMQVQKFVDQNNFDGASKFVSDFKKDQLHHYVDFERDLNTLGYDYLTRHDVDRAIAVLKINVESFPNSWNAYDSLGEAYLAKGNRELAVENYRKSLELNPKNETARNIINHAKPS